jgi:hypothetical protein
VSSSIGSAQPQLGLGGSQQQVTEWFQQQLIAALQDPLFNVPKIFETWMIDRVAVAGFSLPIGQVIGFHQFTMQAATEIQTSQSTTSGTYTDLATVGPTLSNLPDGQYVFFFGATVTSGTSGISVYMGLQLNATTPGSATQLISTSAQTLQATRVSIGTLTEGANTVTAKYRTDLAATGTFSNRYLYALKVANA